MTFIGITSSSISSSSSSLPFRCDVLLQSSQAFSMSSRRVEFCPSARPDVFNEAASRVERSAGLRMIRFPPCGVETEVDLILAWEFRLVPPSAIFLYFSPGSFGLSLPRLFCEVPRRVCYTLQAGCLYRSRRVFRDALPPLRAPTFLVRFLSFLFSELFDCRFSENTSCGWVVRVEGLNCCLILV